MQNLRKNNKRNYLFSQRLTRQLERMEEFPLTVVEAPSGFGKTTAVQEYLKKYLHGRPWHCYTCLGESPAKAWTGICGLFAMIDNETALDLQKLEFPDTDTLADLAWMLRRIRCDSQNFLVIDNYQLIGGELPRQIINAFSTHSNPNLHIVVITQPLKDTYKPTVHYGNIHRINAVDLLFDKETTAAYFRLAGIRLTDGELDTLHNSAEGWISAIRLQMINYQQTGTFARTADIDQLVRMTVWNRLSDRERIFLLSVAILDGFTTKQAQIMLKEAPLPESIQNLLEGNSFIRYFPEKDLYTMHSILQDYLRNHFYNQQLEDFQRLILQRAGQSCAAVGDYYAAAQFYFRISDFNEVLSLPLDGVYLNNQKEKDVMVFITDLVNSCPEDILCHYPLVCVALAFHLYMGGQREAFGKLCRLISHTLESAEGLSDADFNRIRGEFALLTSFNGYNDIKKMSEGHRIAMECLNGPSMFLNPGTPWTFMNVSVLNMYWSKAGELKKELGYMDECMPIYSQIVQGHGTSADTVMRAEALLMQGKDEEAEVLCHKSLYLGKSQNQTGLCLCAELVLARIAMLRGDGEGYRMVLDRLGEYSMARTDRFVQRMTEMCTATLTLALGETQGMADWIYDPERMKKVLYVLAVPYGHILYGKLLLLKKRYNELYGLSGLMLGMAGEMHYLLPQVYHYLYLAIANHAQGRTEDAQKNLLRALNIALPDKVYLPFAEHGNALRPLFEQIYLPAQDQKNVDVIVKLCRRQEAGMKAIRKLLAPQKNILTPREREIALLAKERLTAKEIADRLFIAESTVRSALKIIYSKLNIHSKAQLTDISF